MCIKSLNTFLKHFTSCIQSCTCSNFTNLFRCSFSF
nr:MAG TPA: hypothetical protein [Caudoviricetes sp.]